MILTKFICKCRQQNLSIDCTTFCAEAQKLWEMSHTCSNIYELSEHPVYSFEKMIFIVSFHRTMNEKKTKGAIHDARSTFMQAWWNRKKKEKENTNKLLY